MLNSQSLAGLRWPLRLREIIFLIRQKLIRSFVRYFLSDVRFVTGNIQCATVLEDGCGE